MWKSKKIQIRIEESIKFGLFLYLFQRIGQRARENSIRLSGKRAINRFFEEFRKEMNYLGCFIKHLVGFGEHEVMPLFTWNLIKPGELYIQPVKTMLHEGHHINIIDNGQTQRLNFKLLVSDIRDDLYYKRLNQTKQAGRNEYIIIINTPNPIPGVYGGINKRYFAAILSSMITYIPDSKRKHLSGYELDSMYLQNLLALYHPYTYNHSVLNTILMERLSEITPILRERGFPTPSHLNIPSHIIRNASMLHDIGKVLWPLNVLDSSSVSFKELQPYKITHVVTGAILVLMILWRSMTDMTMLSRLLSFVLWHHDEIRGFPTDKYPTPQDVILYMSVDSCNSKQTEDSLSNKGYLTDYIDNETIYLVGHCKDERSEEYKKFNFREEMGIFLKWLRHNLNPLMDEIYKLRPNMNCTCELAFFRICDSISAMVTRRHYQSNFTLENAGRAIESPCPVINMIKDYVTRVRYNITTDGLYCVRHQ